MLRKRLPLKGIAKGKVKIFCLRLTNNRNRIYNTSLSHKREHKSVLVLIGKKVLPHHVCGSVLQCDTIDGSQVLSSVSFSTVNLKKWASVK